MAMRIQRGYGIGIIGDGTSASIDINLYDAVNADSFVHNKNAVSATAFDLSGTYVVSSVSLVGATVTINFSDPVPNGQVVSMSVTMLFPGT